MCTKGYQDECKPWIIDGSLYERREILALPDCIVALGRRGTIYSNSNVPPEPLTNRSDNPTDDIKMQDK